MSTHDDEPSEATATPRLEGFLSDHRSPIEVVDIDVEPAEVFVEEGRNGQHLNFDFVLTGLTARNLILVFLKVAAYDVERRLLTYRYLNRNAVGVAGLETVVNTRIDGMTRLGLFNPFHTFPRDMAIDHLRYMFTFHDSATDEEHYVGDVVVRPSPYEQIVELDLPVHGLVTVLDGHDYLSHHRRFDVNVLADLTDGAMKSNGSRFALDFVHIGDDGNTRRMRSDERESNYDFRFVRVERFYSDRAPVFAPADGAIVVVVDELRDHYDGAPFDSAAAFAEGRPRDLAGNHVVIKHNEHEYSHLYHFLNGSIEVVPGQQVRRGDQLGRIGFSGAATTYSHLHYALMDGPAFETAESLPVRFRRVTLVEGARWRDLTNVSIDTGDIVFAPPGNQ